MSAASICCGIPKCLGLRQQENTDDFNIAPFDDPDPAVLDWLSDLCPSKSQLWVYLVGLFPFLKWIRQYNRQWFVGDVIAGTAGYTKPKIIRHLPTISLQ